MKKYSKDAFYKFYEDCTREYIDFVKHAKDSISYLTTLSSDDIDFIKSSRQQFNNGLNKYKVSEMLIDYVKVDNQLRAVVFVKSERLNKFFIAVSDRGNLRKDTPKEDRKIGGEAGICSPKCLIDVFETTKEEGNQIYKDIKSNRDSSGTLCIFEPHKYLQ